MSKHRHKKESGGRIGMVAAGNPDVIKEAEGKEDYAKGGGVKPRLDRPGRKSGGRVGSDRSPMSSAHMHAKPGSAPAEEEGGQPR